MANIKNRSTIFLFAGVFAVVLIIAYIVITYIKSSSTLPSKASIDKLSTSASTTTIANESEEYKENLQAYNENKADKAEKGGDSYVAVLSDLEAKKIQSEKELEKKTEEVNEENKNAKPEPVKYIGTKKTNSVKVVSYDKDEQKRIEAQVTALLQEWSEPATHSIARLPSNEGDGEKYVESVNYNENDFKSADSLDDINKIDKIVDDYEFIPAVLLTELNSDENSLVTAFVPNGKYKGSYLFADGYTLQYENIDLTFNKMVFNGETYKVQAKPVDTETLRTSLKGDVNTRWFQTVILPAVANAFGEAGSLYKDANKTIMTNGFTSVEALSGLPSATALAGVGLGGAATSIGKKLEAESQKIPFKKVIVQKNTVIGVRFIGSVTKLDKVLGSQDISNLPNQKTNDANSISKKIHKIKPIPSLY